MRWLVFLAFCFSGSIAAADTWYFRGDGRYCENLGVNLCADIFANPAAFRSCVALSVSEIDEILHLHLAARAQESLAYRQARASRKNANLAEVAMLAESFYPQIWHDMGFSVRPDFDAGRTARGVCGNNCEDQVYARATALEMGESRYQVKFYRPMLAEVVDAIRFGGSEVRNGIKASFKAIETLKAQGPDYNSFDKHPNFSMTEKFIARDIVPKGKYVFQVRASHNYRVFFYQNGESFLILAMLPHE